MNTKSLPAASALMHGPSILFRFQTRQTNSIVLAITHTFIRSDVLTQCTIETPLTPMQCIRQIIASLSTLVLNRPFRNNSTQKIVINQGPMHQFT